MPRGTDRYDEAARQGRLWVPYGLSNEIQNSEYDANWSSSGLTLTANAALAPNGTLTAATAFASSTANTTRYANSTNSFSAAASTTYTFSFWLKSTTNNCFIQVNNNGASAVPVGYFDLTNVSSNVQDLVAGVTNKASTITSQGDGWFLCTMTFTTTGGTSSLQVFMGPCVTTGPGDTRSYTGVVGQGITLWGMSATAASDFRGYLKTGTSVPVSGPSGPTDVTKNQAIYAWQWFRNRNTLPASHRYRQNPPLIGF